MGKVIEAVYEKGVFKPLQSVELEEGAKVLIEIKEGIADILEKFSRKVNEDVLKEFLEERR
ncbi:antitoxin family protein [Archaeoglobus sp.]